MPVDTRRWVTAMAGRGFASLIGLVGGLLIVGGALITLLGRLSSGAVGGVGTSGLLVPFIVLALGFGVLVVARPRLFWWPGRRTFNALLLVGLGLVVWALSSANLLAVIGAFLSILAGIVLVVEGFFPRSLGLRRWFRLQ